MGEWEGNKGVGDTGRRENRREKRNRVRKESDGRKIMGRDRERRGRIAIKHESPSLSLTHSLSSLPPLLPYIIARVRGERGREGKRKD